MKPFPIFKAGKHIASDGTRLTFSEDDLKGLVNSYDPTKHEAPIVIGHPKDNAPAYGWIKGLAFSEDGMITAEAAQVADEFTELVQSGAYKKRSASLYPPDSPSNPVPGSYYLRHVGFLGAQPPAIKGMPDPQFCEFSDDDGAIEFADPQFTASILGLITQGLRDWFIQEQGVEEADKHLPQFLIDELKDQARTPNESPETAPGFSEGDNDPTGENTVDEETLKKQQEDFAAKQAEFAEQQKAFTDQQTAFQRKQYSDFADRMVSDGKMLPSQRPGAEDFMAALDESVELSFGEGDEAKKVSPSQWFKDFLAAQPKAVDLGERSAEDDNPPAGAMTAKELSDKAVEYQEAKRKAGIELNIVQAMQAVQSGETA